MDLKGESQKETLRSSSSSGALASVTQNPLIKSIRSAYASFKDRREALGLSNPGSVENISREVTRDVFLNNYMFTGLRADLQKSFSQQPFFQTAHNLAMGGDSNPYSFAVLYGSPKIFLQGNIDNDFALSARANYRWNPALISKASMQLAPGEGQSVVTFETDYSGADFYTSLKAMNPSVFDDTLTGVFIASHLQSITPRLSLGLETIWQRPSGEEGPNTAISYAARYKALDWMASAQILPQGGIQTSYWRKLAERIEAGVDLNLQFVGLSGGGANPMMMGAKNDGSATFGAKYDFRAAAFRGQVDSNGKVSAWLDKRIAEVVSVTLAAEMDHAKNSTKLGMAVTLDMPGSNEFLEAQEKAVASGIQPSESQLPPFQ